MSDTFPLETTHVYNNDLLHQVDENGRISYVHCETGHPAQLPEDAEPTPIEELLPAEDENAPDEGDPYEEVPASPLAPYEVPPPPQWLDGDVYAVAVQAYNSPGGYAEKYPYVAKRSGENEVHLSLPAPEDIGGHHTYRVKLAERVRVRASIIQE